MQQLTQNFIIVARAQSSTRQCLREYIFLPHICLCAEIERKFIQKDCKIHIEVPENY